MGHGRAASSSQPPPRTSQRRLRISRYSRFRGRPRISRRQYHATTPVSWAASPARHCLHNVQHSRRQYHATTPVSWAASPARHCLHNVHHRWQPSNSAIPNDGPPASVYDAPSDGSTPRAAASRHVRSSSSRVWTAGNAATGTAGNAATSHGNSATWHATKAWHGPPARHGPPTRVYGGSDEAILRMWLDGSTPYVRLQKSTHSVSRVVCTAAKEHAQGITQGKHTCAAGRFGEG